jgi:hypothetical protein
MLKPDRIYQLLAPPVHFLPNTVRHARNIAINIYVLSVRIHGPEFLCRRNNNFIQGC